MEQLQLFLTTVQLILMAGMSAMGEEDTVLVTSIPWVTERLQNPCHLLDRQQDLEDDPRDPNVTLDQQREVMLSNILFANATLLGFRQILNNECNMPFSLLTLPSPPAATEENEQEWLGQMNRELLYLASHYYFVINNTDPNYSFCTHETNEFLHRLIRLTGLLENILCRLSVLVENREHVEHAVEEVSGLRLMHESSCGGRGLWTCILISRTKRSLLTLRRLVLPDPQGSASEATSQSKRLPNSAPLAGVPPKYPAKGPLQRPISTSSSMAFLVTLQRYLNLEHPMYRHFSNTSWNNHRASGYTIIRWSSNSTPIYNLDSPKNLTNPRGSTDLSNNRLHSSNPGFFNLFKSPTSSKHFKN